MTQTANPGSPDEAIWRDRIVDLDGGQNFREVGGYPTRAGQRLRRRLLWRSASLADLSARDVERIRSLGIRTIADLRRTEERADKPTSPGLLGAVDVLSWDIETIRDEALQQTLFRPGQDKAYYIDAISDLYRSLAEQHVVHLRELYTALADDALPALIHCAAGKDRTGIAVALLLELLGVDRETVLADYAKTESLLDWSRLNAAAAEGAGVERTWMSQLDPVAREMLIRSDRRYLEAALAEVEARYGTVGNFAQVRLGLGTAVTQQLRERLLEPMPDA